MMVQRVLTYGLLPVVVSSKMRSEILKAEVEVPADPAETPVQDRITRLLQDPVFQRLEDAMQGEQPIINN